MELRIDTLEVAERLVKMEVWEAGQIDTPLLAPYYKAAKAVIVVFDPADTAESLAEITRVRDMTHTGQLCVAVAHLKGEQTLEPSPEIRSYCTANGVQLETANAQADLNVLPLFLSVCQKCLPPA